MIRGLTTKQFIEILKQSKTYSEIVKKLGLTLNSGNHRTIKNYIKNNNLDDTHLVGQAWRKGLPPNKPFSKKNIEDYLKENYVIGNTNYFKKRLIKEGYFEYKCYVCNNTKWMEKPIPLQLEHINGNKYDNRIENLTILCANCHAQTSTYGGKNIAYKKSLREEKKKKSIYRKIRKTTLLDSTINERIKILGTVDINKYGWVVNLSKEWKISHTQVRRFIKKFKPELLKIAKQRNSRVILTTIAKTV